MARIALGSAHRRQRRRHDADLQLAALGLRRARGVVLGCRTSAAPARRRRAARAWWTPRRSCSPRSRASARNPPPDERRRHLPAARRGSAKLGLQVSTGLAMAIGLEHLRVRSQQHHPRHRRADHSAALALLAHRASGWASRENPMLTGDAGRRTVLQLHPARLRHSGGADGDRWRGSSATRGRSPITSVRGRHRDRAGAGLSHAGGAHAVPRAGADAPDHLGRGALHLLGGLARLRRGAAAGRASR